MLPTISVIIPIYNAARYLNEALVSVMVATQTVAAEIIVVNDGSTDDTETVVKPWQDKITYLVQENLGAAAARNRGLAVATGQYIAFIDSDDVWSEDHITCLQQLLTQYPERQVALGYSQRFTMSASCTTQPITELPKYGKPVFMPSLGCGLFKAEVFSTIGPLTEKYRWHEDVDWYLRAVEAGIQFCITQKVVKYYRLHDRNTTHDWQPTDPKILHVLAASIARRKGSKIPALKEFEV